jgi:hypothetical protein
VRGDLELEEHRPVGAFAPCWVGVPGEVQAVRPRPDLQSRDSAIAGAAHRFACEMPARDPLVVGRFMEFARCFIKARFPRAPADTDVSIEAWLAGAPYTKVRKAQLLKLFADKQCVYGQDYHNKSFIKCESYDTYKAPRPINSYSDESKAQVGPYAHAADEAIFSTKYFVKHVDVRERPVRLRDTFGTRRVKGTDFSSMEAHHYEDYAELSLIWQSHVLRDVSGASSYVSLLEEMCMGVNKCEFKSVTVETVQRLMSGKMTTSSDNGVLNLCLLKFLLVESNNPGLSVEGMMECEDNYDVLVEGDDGIFDDALINSELVSSLGLKLKLDSYESFSDASFCGILSDPESLENVTNPYKAMADFAVLDPKWLRSSDSTKADLVRAKALSYAYVYRGAPVITALAHFAMRATSGRDVSWTLRTADAYQHHLLSAALKEQAWKQRQDVTMSARILVEKVYGMTIQEQIAVESYLDSLNGLTPINPPCSFPDLWVKHAADYVTFSLSDVQYPKPHYPDFVRDVRSNGKWVGSAWCDVPKHLKQKSSRGQ